jgi:hypothetical protein
MSMRRSTVDDDFWGQYDRCECGAVPGEPCISMRAINRERAPGPQPDYVKRPHRDRPKRTVELSDFRHTLRAGAMPEQLAALRVKLLGEVNIGAEGRDLVAVGKELLILDGALPADPKRSRADFQRLRDRLAEQVDEADERGIPPRDVAAMARLLRELIVTLDSIPSEQADMSNVVVIAKRTAAKRREAESLGDPADGGRDVRPGSG